EAGGGLQFENSRPEEFDDRLIADFPEQSDRLANLSTPQVRRDTDPLLPKTSLASWQPGKCRNSCAIKRLFANLPNPGERDPKLFKQRPTCEGCGSRQARTAHRVGRV